MFDKPIINGGEVRIFDFARGGVPAGDLLHGTNKSWQIEGGILHFFVDFDHTIRREVDNEKMKDADISVGRK